MRRLDIRSIQWNRSMKQAISAAEAAALIPDGATILYGGFMGVGTPERVIDALVVDRRRLRTTVG